MRSQYIGRSRDQRRITGGESLALTNASAGADIIIARGVDTVADLKGKKVALELGSVSHFFFSKVIEKAGLSESDVEIVNMSAQDAGTAFVAKAIDVSVTWEPFASQGIAAGGKALVTSKDTPNLIIDISRPATMCSSRNDDVKRLLDSWFDALAFVDTNKDEAFAIMAKHSDVKVDEFAGMWAGVKMYSRPENITLIGTSEKLGRLCRCRKSLCRLYGEGQTYPKGCRSRDDDRRLLTFIVGRRPTRPPPHPLLGARRSAALFPHPTRPIGISRYDEHDQVPLRPRKLSA